VAATLAYDAWLENRHDFLTRVADLATAAELERLRHCERARLHWWALVQRFERATVQVVGISQEQATASPVADSATVTATLQVEVLRVTQSDLATVRDFVAVTLVAVRTPTEWRVDRASGGGL
jgi:hypothetical protein